MHLLELPDDLLRAIVSALLATCADDDGFVPLGRGVCGELNAVARAHRRLCAAVHRELDAVCIDADSAYGTTLALVQAAKPPRVALCGRTVLTPALLCGLPLRELRVSACRLGDGALAALMCPSLRRLSVSECALGAASLSAIGGCTLQTLKLWRVCGVTPRALRRLLACGSLREVALDVAFPAAPHVADKCVQLTYLELGRADTIPSAIARAVTANCSSLQHIVVAARQVNGAAVLSADAVSLFAQCHALRSVDVGPLPGVVLRAPRRWQVTTEYVRGDDDFDIALAHAVAERRRNLRAPALDWDGLAAARGLELGLLHCALRTLVLRAVAGCSDGTLRAVGARTGRLRRVRLEQLPDVTALGVEALLRPNSRVTAFGVGAKCRKLSNVGIMRALARHARALRVATFPRWSAAAGRAADPHLAAALAAFRAAVPNAKIRAE